MYWHLVIWFLGREIIRFIVQTETHRCESVLLLWGDNRLRPEHIIIPFLVTWSFKDQRQYKSNCLSSWLDILFCSHFVFCPVGQVLEIRKCEQIFNKEQWDEWKLYRNPRLSEFLHNQTLFMQCSLNVWNFISKC